MAKRFEILVKGETLFLDWFGDEPWQKKDRLCCGEAATLEDAIEQAEKLSQQHHYLCAAQLLMQTMTALVIVMTMLSTFPLSRS